MRRLSRDYTGLAESFERRAILFREDERLSRRTSTVNDDDAAA
jgi:hypothetical protein